jgi:hypothetical protein
VPAYTRPAVGAVAPETLEQLSPVIAAAVGVGVTGVDAVSSRFLQEKEIRKMKTGMNRFRIEIGCNIARR